MRGSRGPHDGGACMAGSMHGKGVCVAGGVHGRGHAWQRGACLARGCAWQGVCMAGGAVWQGSACMACTHPRQILRDMVNEQVVCILLECILVILVILL